MGYATANDLARQSGPVHESLWGLGAGAVFANLTQGSKSFSTEDEVVYKIDGYSGQNTNPAITLQMGRRNFWRIYGMYRTVGLEGTATNNIAGSPAQKIQVEYKMAGVGLQAGWRLFADFFYAGLGVEADKTLSGTVKYGKQDISSQTEFPFYLIAQALAGIQLRASPQFSLVLEGRAGAAVNQSPTVNVMEVGVSTLYWP